MPLLLDSHLDNLLVTKDGDLFHVDFGYMLGRDPKPYPPPMKLTKDMIEAMGGANSVETQRFRSVGALEGWKCRDLHMLPLCLLGPTATTAF